MRQNRQICCVGTAVLTKEHTTLAVKSEIRPCLRPQILDVGYFNTFAVIRYLNVHILLNRTGSLIYNILHCIEAVSVSRFLHIEAIAFAGVGKHFLEITCHFAVNHPHAVKVIVVSIYKHLTILSHLYTEWTSCSPFNTTFVTGIACVLKFKKGIPYEYTHLLCFGCLRATIICAIAWH